MVLSEVTNTPLSDLGINTGTIHGGNINRILILR